MIENFLKFDEKIAIIFKEKTYTYNALHVKIQNIQKSILKDIKSGEVVGILSDYSFESIALFLALSQNKNIIVPIASKVQNEINEKLESACCDKVISIKNDEFILTRKESLPKHEMLQSLQKNFQAGLILFSSGSTGKPKAMVHNLDNLIANFKNKKEKNLNLLIFLMFDHIGGLNTLLNILSMGATMIIPKSRDVEEVCFLVQKYKIKVLPSSPTFLNLILISKAYEKYDLTSLRMITYGTEAMSESLLKRLKDVFAKVKFLQTFGTSETGIANTSSLSSNSTFMKIDDKNLEYKIVNDELYLKSKTQVMGYLNASMDSFTDDGWFKTGDLVELENGFIKIIGRNKEMINVGGEKVLPNEVEQVLMQMPQIKDVLVYAMPNAITTQMVVCDVVLDEKIDKKDIKKLIRKFCKNSLENYKIPTKVNVVEQTNFTDRFKKVRIKQT